MVNKKNCFNNYMEIISKKNIRQKDTAIILTMINEVFIITMLRTRDMRWMEDIFFWLHNVVR